MDCNHAHPGKDWNTLCSKLVEEKNMKYADNLKYPGALKAKSRLMGLTRDSKWKLVEIIQVRITGENEVIDEDPEIDIDLYENEIMN